MIISYNNEVNVFITIQILYVNLFICNSLLISKEFLICLCKKA
jgi:hypothetical protein